MKNKLISIISILVLSMVLVGCGNNLANKSIENAKLLIKNKNYDKAILALEIALDEEPENGEANKLYRILEKYMEANKLIKNNKFVEAEEIINKLNPSLFTGLSIEEDINNLKNIINENGIYDYKWDKLCPKCWKNKANEVNNKRLCDECSWNEAYSNKATCAGCEGNIVNASLAGTMCPDCGYEFKIISVN